MGALHAGHLSLVRAALAECSPVIASIFVNPAQFGPNEDFQKYPRAFDADCKKLEDAGVDYLFAPEPSEIYPPGFRTWVNVEGLSDRLEGRVRPGHFRGVSTVVLKLLEIVQPRKAFSTRKDAQLERESSVRWPAIFISIQKLWPARSCANRMDWQCHRATPT